MKPLQSAHLNLKRWNMNHIIKETWHLIRLVGWAGRLADRLGRGSKRRLFPKERQAMRVFGHLTEMPLEPSYFPYCFIL